MPANPKHVKRSVEISDEYHEQTVTVDFYTNSAIAIYRGTEDNPEGRVWVDNLEKRELLKALEQEIYDTGNHE